MKAITRDNNNDLSENVQGRRDKGEGVTCPYGLPIFGRCISSFSINGIGTYYVQYMLGLVPTKIFVIPTTLKSNSENAGAPERKGNVTSPSHFFAKGPSREDVGHF